MDIGPLSKGHALVIPKCELPFGLMTGLLAPLSHIPRLVHGEKLHDVPDEYLTDTLTIAKKIAVAQGLQDYNILQVRT